MSVVPEVYHDSEFQHHIIDAVLARSGKQQGQEILFRCPMEGHEDRHPSARWNAEKATWFCDVCKEGGGVIDLAARLGVELPPSQSPSPEWQMVAPAGCTLDDYATAKRLPRQQLESFGLTPSTYDGRPAIRIPYYLPDGREGAVRFRINMTGRDRFRWQKGSRTQLYGLDRLSGYGSTVVLVEGESDCHTAWVHEIPALGIPGASNWREDRDAPLLSGFSQIFVVIEPDMGGAAVTRWLQASAIRDRVFVVDPGEYKDLSGIHLSGRDFDGEWTRLLEAAEPWNQVADRLTGPPYSDNVFAIKHNVHHQYIEPKITRDGEMVGGGWKPLANFSAYVVSDASFPEDDSLNYSEVVLQDRKGRKHGPKRVEASKFRRPDDWLGRFGSWPRVFPGVTAPVLLNAIQSASGTAPTKIVYNRTGWTTDAGWRFLSASGAMTPRGLDESVRVEPGGRLEGIALQDPVDGEKVRDAVRLVIDMAHGITHSDDGRIATHAMLAAAFRAPLIPAKRANFTLTLMGVTGSVKSGLAGLVASLYGSAFNYDHLHGSWQSTLNSLVDLISRPRHTMIVIDDYLEKEAGNGVASRRAVDRDTLIRHQGNGSTRSRLNSDATRNDGVDPSVILVSTQETLGSYLDESEIGRQLIIPMKKGCLGIEQVKRHARELGRTGVYNLGFSAYIQYLTSHMPRIVDEAEAVHDQIERTRLADLATASGRRLHERTRPAAADLLLGWHYFLEFALAIGAIDRSEHAHVTAAVSADIAGLMLLQDQFQSNEAPERAFIELLQEAINSKHACLASRTTNDVPGDARMLGWTPVERQTRDDAWTEFRPAPHRIGWVDEEYVYLGSVATAKALQGMAASARKNVPLGERSIGPHLARHGISLPGQGGRYTQMIRIGENTEGGGTTARVLVIPRHVIFPLADGVGGPVQMTLHKAVAA